LKPFSKNICRYQTPVAADEQIILQLAQPPLCRVRYAPELR
jgi:hypothetical protein